MILKHFSLEYLVEKINDFSFWWWYPFIYCKMELLRYCDLALHITKYPKLSSALKYLQKYKPFSDFDIHDTRTVNVNK